MASVRLRLRLLQNPLKVWYLSSKLISFSSKHGWSNGYDTHLPPGGSGFDPWKLPTFLLIEDIVQCCVCLRLVHSTLQYQYLSKHAVQYNEVNEWGKGFIEWTKFHLKSRKDPENLEKYKLRS